MSFAVSDGEVGEEVAVDKQCQGTVRAAGEVDGGEVLIAILLLVLLRSDGELVVLGGGVTARCRVKALAQ